MYGEKKVLHVLRSPRLFRKDISPVSIRVEISKRRHAICDRAKKKRKKKKKRSRGTNGSYGSDSPLCSRGRYPLFGFGSPSRGRLVLASWMTRKIHSIVYEYADFSRDFYLRTEWRSNRPRFVGTLLFSRNGGGQGALVYHVTRY